ncbi:MAG TPA: hypothetical protein VMG38_10215 [Trebonia sp.]|nr:hypothetical protein [Trebonia sp.]
MTDLETLRRALRASDEPASVLDGPDLASIMARGRRLRVRHRVTAASGVLCLAGLVIAVLTGVLHLSRPASPAPQRPQAPSYSRPEPTATPTPSATRPQPVPAHSIAPVPGGPSPVASPSVPSARPSQRHHPAGPAATGTVPTPLVAHPASASPVN